MTALQQWRDELAAGARTVLTFDRLWNAAARETADAEFAAYVAPVRREVQRLRALAVVAQPEPLADRYPALEAWRRITIEQGGRSLDVAAAWEYTAMQCDADGADDAARMAMEHAAAIIDALAAASAT